ncbi:chorismate mutase [Cytobacillus sp. Sa5YUA1]|uniref:chorismate mutase n=1 Tax=Cytobacillus stercorigallinarum TaxID=2762240 RepID=A0ABR8QKL6_9BACI|nr:chorismate mutase [Cytobacillus stercorigallinarum]MBD7936070.1 chorismate mutase [Cytobacillus stercorigallinarum]
MIRGVRGAVTVEKNEENEIVAATEQLLREMIKENQIDAHSVVSVFISVTDDITEAFPAKALRAIEGWTYVPVMCMREIPVPKGLTKCIRVMMHVNTEIAQEKISHIYLGNAVSLRPDLQQEELNR